MEDTECMHKGLTNHCVKLPPPCPFSVHHIVLHISVKTCH